MSDDDGLFHSSATAVDGKIIAEKNGLKSEIRVTMKGVSGIKVGSDNLLLDGNREYMIPIEGSAGGSKYQLDPGAFSWTSTNPGTVVRLITVIIKGPGRRRNRINRSI